MAAQERSIPVHLLQPSKTTSSGSAMSMSTVTSATTGSTDDTSTVLSSQWSEKRHQMYQMMTPDEQDLFDELQREIEELRKLLGGKNKNAADKVCFLWSEPSDDGSRPESAVSFVDCRPVGNVRPQMIRS